MRAEIKREGKVFIVAQTSTEAFALLYLIQELPTGLPIVFDTSILDIPDTIGTNADIGVPVVG